MSLFEEQQKEFAGRHIGPDENETTQMLETIGTENLEELINSTVPPSIRMKKPLNIPAAISENDYLQHIKEISPKNKIFNNYIG